jgi:hypothetical protein
MRQGLRQYYEAQQNKVASDITRLKRSFLQLLNDRSQELSGWQQVNITEPIRLYKLVAAYDGKLLSVWDGQTAYELGRFHRAKCGASSWPPLFSCFFAFESQEEVLNAIFPAEAKLRYAPRVLIEIEATGQAYKRGNVWAVSKFKMVAIE